MSPIKVPAGVTTFPPLTIVSKATDRLGPAHVDAFLLTADDVASEDLPATDDPRCVAGFFFGNGFLLGKGSQRAIEHVQGKVHIFGLDAHRRLNAKHVAIEPAFPDEHAHFSRRLEYR